MNKKIKSIFTALMLIVVGVGSSFVFSACSFFTDESSYMVNVYVNNSRYGTVTGRGEYKKGDVVTLTATPKSGCCFGEWEYDGNCYIANKDRYKSTISFVFDYDKDITLIANFHEGECIEIGNNRLFVQNCLVKENNGNLYLSPKNKDRFGYWAKKGYYDSVFDFYNAGNILFVDDIDLCPLGEEDTIIKAVDSCVGFAGFASDDEHKDSFNQCDSTLTDLFNVYERHDYFNQFYVDFEAKDNTASSSGNGTWEGTNIQINLAPLENWFILVRLFSYNDVTYIANPVLYQVTTGQSLTYTYTKANGNKITYKISF